MVELDETAMIASLRMDGRTDAADMLTRLRADNERLRAEVIALLDDHAERNERRSALASRDGDDREAEDHELAARAIREARGALSVLWREALSKSVMQSVVDDSHHELELRGLREVLALAKSALQAWQGFPYSMPLPMTADKAFCEAYRNAIDLTEQALEQIP